MSGTLNFTDPGDGARRGQQYQRMTGGTIKAATNGGLFDWYRTSTPPPKASTNTFPSLTTNAKQRYVHH